MKKNVAIITAIMLSLSGLAFAEMNDQSKEMNGKGMMGMMEMHHGMMSKSSMVAVSDGVIILSGNKLYKYDNNLNLVKEANLKVEKMCLKGDKKICLKGNKSATKKEEKSVGEKHTAHHS